MTNEAATANKPMIAANYKWSVFGVGWLILLPLFLWVAGEYFLLDGKPVLSQGNHPGVILTAEVFGGVVLKIGAFVSLAFSIMRLLRSPSSSTPEWMVVKKISSH